MKKATDQLHKFLEYKHSALYFMLKCGAITALENYNFTLSTNFITWNYPSHTLFDGEGNFIKESQCFAQHKHVYPRARTCQRTVF